MSNNDIQNYLPHRYPFLLIDKIIDFKKHDYFLSYIQTTEKVTAEPIMILFF